MSRSSSLRACVALCAAVVACGAERHYGYVTWPRNGNFDLSVTDKYADIPSYYVAKATFQDKINETGWAFLELHTSADNDDKRQAFAAGYLEGFLTRNLIWMHWQNVMQGFCDGREEVCNRIESYIDKNENFIRKMIRTSPADPYWHQVSLVYTQLEGLAFGYDNATLDPAEKLSLRNLLWFNMLGDLEDLTEAFGEATPAGGRRVLGLGHCSALVKLLPDMSDVYVAHDTWNSYQSMLRIQKKYVLNYKMTSDSTRSTPVKAMSFSSYPAMIQSADDFYIMSSGLVTLETTIGNSNQSLYENVEPSSQVLEFVRTMVANRLAVDGKEWVTTFKKYNSGTYNNQWIIVDFKRFRPKQDTNSIGKIKSGFLWILEQLPGYVEAQDMTSFLVANMYWPSYNAPYFQSVFNMSGGPENVAKYGDWFSYDKTPRALIFKRDQGGVHSMEDMMALMRYNDFKHDPLSKCECQPPFSAENSIAARNDLNPANGTYPFAALGHRSHGATDAKITNWRLAQTLQFTGVSGPIHNLTRNIPPFIWSRTDFGGTISHVGHPDSWTFKPLTHKWEWGQD